MLFLSTLSLRRATLFALLCNLLHNNFYPRSPCGERLNIRQIQKIENEISIHALLAESDINKRCQFNGDNGFLSTLSLRRATNDAINGCNPDFISIHALLAESDWWLRCWQLAARDISIHALLAESDVFTTIITICIVLFLSTLSLRRATETTPYRVSETLISIHALLAESDPPIREIVQWEGIFLSTLSLRRATNRGTYHIKRNENFYPRSPCGERPSPAI